VQIYEKSILRITEFFYKEVVRDAVQCKMLDDKNCLFSTMPKKESKEKTRGKIRKMLI
jgi:polyferredoxin